MAAVKSSIGGQQCQFELCVCVRTLSRCDAQPQRVPSSPQDLGQVPVLQPSHRPALHRLQLVSGLNVSAASRRAAATHRHKAVRHDGGGCGHGGGQIKHL